MEELAIIAEELKAIREQLTRLADAKQRQEERRNAARKERKAEEPPENLKEMLEKAFSIHDRIKRGDLYELEKMTARQEKRPATNKQQFYKFVLAAGYQLIKSDGAWYFCR